jgi:two-component system, cell cycle response regulator DivK
MKLSDNNQTTSQKYMHERQQETLQGNGGAAYADGNMASQNIDWHDKTILIVEDIPSNYQLLAAYLSRTGANIIHTLNGMPVLEILKENKDIDLILMDLQLPDINGIEITKMIRKEDETIPIIAQTAHALAIDRERCIKAGCNDYIAKPIRKQDFLNIVKQYIHVAQAVS